MRLLALEDIQARAAMALANNEITPEIYHDLIEVIREAIELREALKARSDVIT